MCSCWRLTKPTWAASRGQDDFVIGIAAAGHNLPGNQNLVAHAIGLLPVRTKISDGISFKDYAKTVRGNVLDAFDHQQFTYGSLLKKLKMERSANRNTLVSVAFNLDSPLDNLFFWKNAGKYEGHPTAL